MVQFTQLCYCSMKAGMDYTQKIGYDYSSKTLFTKKAHGHSRAMVCQPWLRTTFMSHGFCSSAGSLCSESHKAAIEVGVGYGCDPTGLDQGGSASLLIHVTFAGFSFCGPLHRGPQFLGTRLSL